MGSMVVGRSKMSYNILIATANKKVAVEIEDNLTGFFKAMGSNVIIHTAETDDGVRKLSSQQESR